MIDFSQTPIIQEKLGSFGDILLRGGIKIDAAYNIAENAAQEEIDFKKTEIRRILHDTVYGDLKIHFTYLKGVLEYLLKDSAYRPLPFNIAEIEESLKKIEKVLERPK